MGINDVVKMLKDSKGIRTSTARDEFFTARVESVIREIQDTHGIAINLNNPEHFMFVVDFAEYRYDKPKDDMPRNLQYRLHNLMIHATKTLYVKNIIHDNILPVSPEGNTVYILPDGSKSMFINGSWTAVDLSDGSWVVI